MVIEGAADGFADLKPVSIRRDAVLQQAVDARSPSISLPAAERPPNTVPVAASNTPPIPMFAPSEAMMDSRNTFQSSGRPVTAHASSSRLLVVDKSLPPVPRPGSVSFDLPVREPNGRPSIHRSASALAFHSQEPGTFQGSSSIYLPTHPSESPKPLFLQPFPTSDTDVQSPPRQARDNPRRRSRGLSLGPLSFFSMSTSDQKAHGNKDTTPDNISKTPQTTHFSQKPISRKSSFWRKGKDTTPPNDLPPQHTSPSVFKSSQLPPQLPAIPIMPSVAPLGLEDLTRGFASSFNPKVGRRLSSRRHSIESLSRQSRPSSPHLAVPVATSHDPPLIPPPTSQSISLPVGALDHVPFPQTDTEQSLLPSLSRFAKRRRAQTNPFLAPSDTGLPRLTIAVPPNEPQPRPSLPSSRPAVAPKPEPGESPEVYLNRLRNVVSKGDLATALAASSQPVYLESLQIFMSEFNFSDEPLDIALRKLLMEVGLPRETQQIDRVVEAFSFHYSKCNPGLFSSGDHAYILAFSLIMLHTDAFNRSNKTKMTKADYIKNASLPGIYPDVLGCFFDNITFSPFIFIEDPLDSHNHGGQSPDVTRWLRTPLNSSPGMLGKPKVDPYYLITNNLLESMKGDLEKIIPVESPFRSRGHGGHFNSAILQDIFWNAHLLQVEFPEKRPLFTMSASDNGIARSSGELTVNSPASPDSPSRNILTLKAVQIGILHRKDDITSRGKRSAVRKWRPWTVLLTTSQIMFFRDTDMRKQLPWLIEVPFEEESICPTVFKPDDVMPLKDSIALYDSSYVKHENTFRLVLSTGRQILLKASDTIDADCWLSCINYASTFKSAGVRPRPMDMSHQDIRLTGVAAATSHLHDLQSQPLQTQWDGSTPGQLMDMLSGTFNQRPPLKHRLTIPSDDRLDLDTISSVQSATSEQFQTTFSGVKADLAGGNSENGGAYFHGPSTSPPSNYERSSLHSRQDFIRQKVSELEEELATIQRELSSETRFLKNIAILRPLQSATRAKLTTAVQMFAASRKLTSLRVQSERLACYITILFEDLEADIDSLASMKSIALDAAKRSLELRQSDGIPRMTVSTHDFEDEPPKSGHTLTRTGSSTSLAESFYSALDHTSDWPLDELEASPISRSASQTFDSPRPSTSSSTPHFGLCPADRRSPLAVERSSSFLSSKSGSHKDLSKTIGPEAEAEEAEPWNRTRAAKRVSLVRVPSSVAFSKQSPSRHLARTSTHLDT